MGDPMAGTEVCSRGGAQAGFSYIWVLLLVAFMGLSLTAAVEVDATNSQRDREKELLSIGRQFRTAIASYHEAQLTAGRKEYPAELTDLLQDKRFPGTRRHLRKVFVDPMNGKSEWGLVKIGGRIVGVHSLSEKEPLKQDGFDAENMGFRGKKKYSEWIFTYPVDLIVRLDAGTGQKLPNSAFPENVPGVAPGAPVGHNPQGMTSVPPPPLTNASGGAAFGNPERGR